METWIIGFCLLCAILSLVGWVAELRLQWERELRRVQRDVEITGHRVTHLERRYDLAGVTRYSDAFSTN